VFLSIVAAPIFQLFQKNGKFLLPRECQGAMDEPKRRQTQSQILIALHSALAIMLTVDASTTIGMRAMLSQLQFDGRARPARFESGIWRSAELKYCQAGMSGIGEGVE